MKVPKKICIAIDQCQKYNLKANIKDEEIRQWLYDNNMLNDSTIDQLIDTVEQGQGDADSLVKWIEKNIDFCKKEGNTYEL